MEKGNNTEAIKDGSFIIPTAEGLQDANEALKANIKAGKWAMIAPDGRTWFNDNPIILFAALANELQGKPNLFGDN